MYCFILQWFCVGAFASSSDIGKIWEDTYIARGLSLDGSTVIGTSLGKSFSWKGGTLTWFPGVPYVDVRGLNADGTVVVGALISDKQFSGAESGWEGGLGLTRHQDNGIGFGGGLFYGKRSSDTCHNGNQKIELIGPGVFAVYAPKNTGLGFEIFSSVSCGIESSYNAFPELALIFGIG